MIVEISLPSFGFGLFIGLLYAVYYGHNQWEEGLQIGQFVTAEGDS